ncbi:glycine zipper family protein [Marinoscillum furvescens]|uniref:Glycine zipper domain-containing protein n=1 Tax=Marinoscillum furvescens DSM 4134 TaxID=1122208 RepID=A0A3D9L7P5_MARFU|nr:glycine zipper family protein [Marinoscillum furvescens]REE02102.1 hypothetical protein C7460_102122 [Marinoscillum furvescens DSM 4134]
MKKSYLLTLLILIISFSCQEQENAIEPTIDYEAFSSELKSNLNQIATQMRSNQSDFSNAEMVSKIASGMLQMNYKNDQRILETFSNGYSRSASIVGLHTNARISSEQIYFSEFDYNLITKVNDLWVSSSSPTHYKNQLTELLEEVDLADVEINEKEQAIIYLTSQLVAVDFIIDNYDLISPLEVKSNGRSAQDNCQPSKPECEESWWDSWGKCAVGTVGGAGTGLLAGGAAGSLIPFIGTTAGAVVGAISGGLTGAATFCGAGGSGCGQPKCPEYECLPCT